MEECQQNKPSMIEIKVIESRCDLMPKGDILILEGPCINYKKSGPVCVTALNAIYPWVMATRFDVRAEALDYDFQNNCYKANCPCGTVFFEMRKIS